MAIVEVKNLSKQYGSHQVLNGINLTIEDGEFAVFVGRSGCGKSTLLRCIAGLESLSSGAIFIDNEDVSGRTPAKREIAMVFQSYALYPHLSVADNLGFSLRLSKVPKHQARQQIERAAEVLQITDLLERKPAQLSGGQRQRVAMGRAIVRNPKAFLFDEPLSNLDADLRLQMRREITQLHKELGATMVYVTHDQVEAMTMADKIVVLNEGNVEQVGRPLDLYRRPRNVFVATFLGSPRMNLLDAEVSAGEAKLAGGQVISGLRQADSRATRIGIRSEHVSVSPEGRSDLRGRLVDSEHLGSERLLFFSIAGADTPFVARDDGMTDYEDGATVDLRIGREHIHQFGPDGLALSGDR